MGREKEQRNPLLCPICLEVQRKAPNKIRRHIASHLRKEATKQSSLHIGKSKKNCSEINTDSNENDAGIDRRIEDYVKEAHEQQKLVLHHALKFSAQHLVDEAKKFNLELPEETSL
jgi:hypothetical protein